LPVQFGVTFGGWAGDRVIYAKFKVYRCVIAFPQTLQLTHQALNFDSKKKNKSKLKFFNSPLKLCMAE